MMMTMANTPVYQKPVLHKPRRWVLSRLHFRDRKTGSALTAPVHITQPLRGGLRIHIRADWGPLSTTLLPTAFLTPGATTGAEHWKPEAGTQGRKRSQSPTWVQEGLASSWASPQPPLTANIKTRGSKMALKRRKKVILRLA